MVPLSLQSTMSVSSLPVNNQTKYSHVADTNGAAGELLGCAMNNEFHQLTHSQDLSSYTGRQARIMTLIWDQ